MSNSLWPHGLQHTRLPCPSPTLEAYSNSCPSSRWCHPTSVIPFSSHLQSFPASGAFPMSQFFSSSSQSTGASGSASVLPVNIQGWSPLGLTGLICMLSKGLPRVFSSTTIRSISSSVLSLLYYRALTSIHDYWMTCPRLSRASVAEVGLKSRSFILCLVVSTGFQDGRPGHEITGIRMEGQQKWSRGLTQGKWKMQSDPFLSL